MSLVTSNPTCEQLNMTTPTAEDRLLVKTSQTDKGWIVDRMIVELPA